MERLHIILLCECARIAEADIKYTVFYKKLFIRTFSLKFAKLLRTC